MLSVERPERGRKSGELVGAREKGRKEEKEENGRREATGDQGPTARSPRFSSGTTAAVLRPL